MNSYTWDRANRLLSMGGADYQYDGEGRRVQQTVGSVVTKYLLDIQPGLAVVLSETTGANTMRYVHSPRGIHAHKDTGGNWEWMVQDGLGSVREVVDNSVSVLESRNYDPYGNPFGATGTSQTGFGFTGELVDGSGLLDLRARRYNAGIGVFASLDPFEGKTCTPMSLNGYGYVHGNPVNWADHTGMVCDELLAACGAALAIVIDGPIDDIPVCGAAILCGGIALVSTYLASRSALSALNDYRQGHSGGGSQLPLVVDLGAADNSDNQRRIATICNTGLCGAGLRYLLNSFSGTAVLPQYTYAKPAGPRITWVPNYPESVDPNTNKCLPCKYLGAINLKFCDVNVVPGHKQTADHVHIYKFHQEPNCYCNVQPDKPYVIPLASPYAGLPGGPYFPWLTPPPNPELAICTGGWIQT